MTAPRRRRKDARPGELACAAMDCFCEQGFAGTKIEDIARRAGVAKGTVYLYFETKDELFQAAVREHIGPVFSGLEALSHEPNRSAADLLRTLLHRIYEQLVDDPKRRAILRVLLAEGPRFPSLTRFYHDAILSGVRDLLGRILARGIESGEFRDGPVARQPQVLIGPALMATIWRLLLDDVAPLDVEAHRDAHVDLVLNGLVAEREST